MYKGTDKPAECLRIHRKAPEITRRACVRRADAYEDKGKKRARAESGDDDDDE